MKLELSSDCWKRAALVSRRCLVAAAATNIIACRATPSPTPSLRPAPAAPACPAPVLRGVEWAFVDDSSFTLALPPGFQERSSGGSFRHFELAADFQQSMTFGTIRGELGLEAYRRAYQATLMLEYSECVDSVGAYTISIQSWRTPNGVFRNSRRFDRYDVFAIWEVRTGVYFYLTGGTHSRRTQDFMLGAIRSWRLRTL